MATVYVFKKDNCPPCEAVQPTLEMLMEEFDQFQWVIVNISTESGADFARKYSITKTPTLLVVADTKPIGMVEGTNEQKLFSVLRFAATKLKPSVEVDDF